MDTSKFSVFDFTGTMPGLYSGNALPVDGNLDSHFLLTTTNELYQWLAGEWVLRATLGGAGYSDQDARDAVGAGLQNTTTIALSYIGSSFTANVQNGSISNTQLASGIDASKIADGSVSNSEYQHLNNVSANIQTQLDGKQPLASNLTSIAGLTGSGLIRQTGSSFSLDSNVYFRANQNISLTGVVVGSGVASGTINTGFGFGAVPSAVISDNWDFWSGTDGTIVATTPIGEAIAFVDTRTNNLASTKQDFITAGTSGQYYRGDKTFQNLNTNAVPESGNLYFTNARAIGATLTGYASSIALTQVASSDTILQALQKTAAYQNNRTSYAGNSTFISYVHDFDNPSQLALNATTNTWADGQVGRPGILTQATSTVQFNQARVNWGANQTTRPFIIGNFQRLTWVFSFPAVSGIESWFGLYGTTGGTTADQTQNNSIVMFVQGSTITLRVNSTTSSSFACAQTAASGAWYKCDLIRNSPTSISFFINNVLQTTVSGGLPASGTPCGIGGRLMNMLSGVTRSWSFDYLEAQFSVPEARF